MIVTVPSLTSSMSFHHMRVSTVASVVSNGLSWCDGGQDSVRRSAGEALLACLRDGDLAPSCTGDAKMGGTYSDVTRNIHRCTFLGLALTLV